MKTFKSQQNWIVEVGDDAWFALSAEQREELLTTIRTEALKENCNSVTIFANPDPVLPVHGIDRRTKVHGEKLGSETEPYTTALTYHAELVPEIWLGMEDREQRTLLKEIRDGLALKGRRNPGRYEVFFINSNGVKNYVERGRV